MVIVNSICRGCGVQYTDAKARSKRCSFCGGEDYRVICRCRDCQWARAVAETDKEVLR